MNRNVLAFAHIGDLHLTRASERSFIDLLAIAAEIETECAAALDFVVLPGDNADNGRPEQYRLAATALDRLSPPAHAIPGDHDMEPGSLAAFHVELAPDALPKSLRIKNCRCLFLDASGRGAGGPDFRLGEAQFAWLEDELSQARAAYEEVVIFCHVYPADLKGDGETERLNRLLGEHRVALFDMGHTHYNEIANEDGTIFAATRSTGQIEEGPVGYSLITLDEGVVSWRFKPLDDPFPFVMITSPADFRLIRKAEQTLSPNAEFEARAIVFGREKVDQVACGFEGQPGTVMQRQGDEPLWTARIRAPDPPSASLTVRALCNGRWGQHVVIPALGRYERPPVSRSGSDAAAIGAWPENGIFGTQLGPNRNGRRW